MWKKCGWATWDYSFFYTYGVNSFCAVHAIFVGGSGVCLVLTVFVFFDMMQGILHGIYADAS